MASFSVTFSNVLLTLLYLFPGFLLCKLRKVRAEHLSSVSVILQRYYFKLTHGKRIFLMSPIHHHFEKKGYSETQIVSMYMNVTLILSLIAILSIL